MWDAVGLGKREKGAVRLPKILVLGGAHGGFAHRVVVVPRDVERGILIVGGAAVEHRRPVVCDVVGGAPGRREPVSAIQKGTRVLISLWDSLMFGWVPKNGAQCLGTREG